MSEKHARRARRRYAALLAAAGLTAAALPSVAHGACASSPVNQSFSDPVGEVPAGLAPDASSLNLSLDSSCVATISYGIADQSELYAGDVLITFIDADGNAATGVKGGGYVGADYSVVRDFDEAIVVRYDAVADRFTTSTPATPIGSFGAQFDLAALGGLGSRVVKIAGATSWESASTGNTYYDWVPSPGLPSFAVPVSLTEPVVPTPAPTPVAPPPVATPSPNVIQSGTAPRLPTEETEEFACEVPAVRGLTLGRAKARLRRAGCTLGAVRYERSRRYAKGRVIRISEDVDTLLLVEDRVRITVSSGPGPRPARR